MDYSPEVEYYKEKRQVEYVFSVMIPTWNNLPYLRLCLRSLEENSVLPLQIILFVNEGSDGTLDFARDAGYDYCYASENVGVCHALNQAAELASAPYLVFLNDDMYVCPGWDKALKKEIEGIASEYFFLSATMIEPRDTRNPCVMAPYDFGQDLNSFREQELLATFDQKGFVDWNGASWPPNVVPLVLWKKVGGYSLEFSPGMYSDPDFSMKLWQAGCRYFRGLGTSRVYHFQAKSTGKVIKNDGRKQFLKKWGILPSAFYRYYLRLGTPWKGPLSDPEISIGFWWARLRSRFHLIWMAK